MGAYYFDSSGLAKRYIKEVGSAWIESLTKFKLEFKSHYFVINLSDQIIDRAMSLAEKHGLRGYDSIQLSTALEVNTDRSITASPPLTFVSADDKLNAAAQAEGLLVENPNNHP